MLSPNVKTSPSSAVRWKVCTISPRYIAEHVTPENALEKSANTVRGDEEHAEAADLLIGKRKRTRKPEVRAYVDYVRRIPGIEIGVELKVPVYYRNEKPCFIDYAKYDAKTDTLHVVDLKTGAKLVQAYQNDQVAIYMESFYREYAWMFDERPKNLVGHIFMPRQPLDLMAQIWKTDYPGLKEVLGVLEEAHEIIERDDPEELEFVVTEEGCRWCDARHLCKAKQSLVETSFEPEVVAGQVTDEFLGKVVKNKKAMIKAINDFATEASRRAYGRGAEFLEKAGLKFVKTRDGNRAWKDGADPVAVLGEEALEPPEERKPLSPTQIEKQLGVEKYSLVKSQVFRPPGGKVLVGLDDKRPAIESGEDAAPKFDNEMVPFEVEVDEDFMS